MATYSTNEFRSGLKVMLDGEPCSILDNEFVKPGKGQAFNRVKLRNLNTVASGSALSSPVKALKGRMSWTVPWSISTPMVNSGTSWSPIPLSNTQADAAAVGDSHQWLKEQDKVEVTLYNGAPLSVAAA